MSEPTTGLERPFELLVADAQRQFEQNGKVQNLSFWSFKVMCRSYLASYQNPPLFSPSPESSNADGKPQNFIDSGAGYVDYCSWHRYSDFEWLVEQLHHDYPGELIPPLPPKENEATKDKVHDLVSSSTNDNPKLIPFVQGRIRWLNMFFQVLMEMKQLHDAPHLKAFVAMEEPQWYNYRKQVDQQRRGHGVQAVASRISKFFGKISSKATIVYDATSEIGRMRDVQEKLSHHLKMCQYRLKDMECVALNPPKKISTLDEMLQENTGKRLPYPLVFNGHFVAHGEEKKNGIVRHVDAYNYAYVEWTTMDSNGNLVPDGSGLQRLPLTALSYPASGVCDPVMFAAVEAVTQLESFFAYIQHRTESRDLEKVIDLVTFWRCYAQNVVDTVKRMADIEQKRYNLALDVGKTTDQAKKQAKQEEVDTLSRTFDDSERAFKTCYATQFRPLQRKGVFNMNLLVGKICFNLLNDDDWPNRLARCEHVLQPDFSVPAEVTEMLEQLANGSPPPGAAESQSAKLAPASPPPRSSNDNTRASSTAVTDSSPMNSTATNVDYASPTRNHQHPDEPSPVAPSLGSGAQESSSSPPARSKEQASSSPEKRSAPTRRPPPKQNSMFESTSDDDEQPNQV